MHAYTESWLSLQYTRLPRRLIAPFLAIAYLPSLLVVVVLYDFFVNSAFDRIDAESLALCILGVPLLFGGALTVARSRPLSFALYMSGLTLVIGSAMGPVLLGHFGLPLLAFGLMAISFVIAVLRLRQTPTQETVTSSFDINPYLALVPALKELPQHSLWSRYDPDTDTLAIHFDEPDALNSATDSAMSDDGIIVRHNDAGEVIGLTILHASSRKTL